MILLNKKLRGILASLVLASLLSACASSPYYDPAQPHHREKGFANLDGSQVNKPFSELLAWWWSRWKDDLPPPPSTHVQGYNFPVLETDVAALRANRDKNSYTWIGHATGLLQTDGLNILTDPIFSERASPVSFAGPIRRTKLPFPPSALPHIDVVVISHNHYDHLDEASILSLNAQPGGPPRFLVPLGIDAWMQDRGISNVRGLDWWQSEMVGQSRITLVPAHHWSARSFGDRNETLWGGWVVKSPTFSFYYSGDTGYAPQFADIGRRFGPFDLATLPVGTYEPRWFMGRQHINPEEAVKIAQDVGARRTIGVHWGTFELSDEALDAPIGDLAQALASRPEAAPFELLQHGQTRWLP